MTTAEHTGGGADELTAHHVGLTVADLERAVAFYRDVLGVPVVDRFAVAGEAFADAVDLPGASGRFVHLDGGGVRLELVEYEPTGDARDPAALNRPGATHVGLTVEDVRAVYASLPDDVETLSEPRTTASGTTVVFLRDPEGNLVELLDA